MEHGQLPKDTESSKIASDNYLSKRSSTLSFHATTPIAPPITIIFREEVRLFYAEPSTW
jgi:hypothetical protein